MAVYRSSNRRGLTNIDFRTAINNQVILSGDSADCLVTKGIFFVEAVYSVAGITIKDGNGNVIAADVTDFSQALSPIRCDYGVQYIGTAVYVKGYVVEDAFEN